MAKILYLFPVMIQKIITIKSNKIAYRINSVGFIIGSQRVLISGWHYRKSYKALFSKCALPCRANKKQVCDNLICMILVLTQLPYIVNS